MQTPWTAIALCTCMVGLSACDKTTPAPPKPVVDLTVPNDSGASAEAVVATPVPSAASVFPPGTLTRADPAPANTDGTRKPAQESTGTLMPGQNNDHSAPLSPAR